jgi:hypothetical protein
MESCWHLAIYKDQNFVRIEDSNYREVDLRHYLKGKDSGRERVLLQIF